MKLGWKIPLTLAILTGVGGWLTVDHRRWNQAVAIWGQLSGSALHAGETRLDKEWTKSVIQRHGYATAGSDFALARSDRSDRSEDGGGESRRPSRSCSASRV